MQTYPLQPQPTGLHLDPAPSPDEKRTADILPLYPDRLPYQRLERCINHVSAILDKHGLTWLADELCDSFNNLPF